MKHIFFVQSNISILIAQQIVEELDLPKEEVFFIFGRNTFRQLHNLRCLDADPWIIKSKRAFWKNWPKLISIRKSVTTFLETEIQTKFTLYLSGHTHYFLYLLKRHKDCQGYHSLEEGYSGYFSINERRGFIKYHFFNVKTIIGTLKSFFNHAFIFYWNPFKGNQRLKSCKKIFTLSNKSYPDFAKKHIVKIPFKYEKKYEDIEEVIALTHLVESNMVPFELFCSTLDELLQKITSPRSEVKTIHVKFHPVHYKQNTNIHEYRKIMNSYKNKIQIIELNPRDSLENIAFTAQPVFHLSISSIAIYAHLCGSEINSYSERIAKQHPPFQKQIDLLPAYLQKILANEKYGYTNA